MKTQWTVVRDSREKKPLAFPKNLVVLDKIGRSTTIRLWEETDTLYKGDYYLRDHEHDGIVERKYTIDEMTINLFSYHRRKLFIKELDYLSERSKVPYVLLDGSPRKFLTPTKRQPYPGVVFDALFDLILPRKIGLLIIPSDTLSARRAMGEIVARLLIRSALLSSSGSFYAKGP